MTSLILSLTMRTFLVPALVCACAAMPARADEDAPAGIEYKLTPSYYRASDRNDAIDVNLRLSQGVHTGWVGAYRDRSGFEQSRAGYEYRQDGEIIRTVWSAQLASRGFAGGALTAEFGGANYAIAGIGRTNMRDYYNLNFDPNDALTIGFGSRAMAGVEWSVIHIWDDRLGTRQQVTHATWRRRFGDAERLSFDVSYKHGLTQDGSMVAGTGLSLTYDRRNMFVRIARDPHANFAAADLTRLSIGLRF